MILLIHPFTCSPQSILCSFHSCASKITLQYLHTSSVDEDPFIFKIICTDCDATATHSKLPETFTDNEDSFKKIGRIWKEFIFFWHNYTRKDTMRFSSFQNKQLRSYFLCQPTQNLICLFRVDQSNWTFCVLTVCRSRRRLIGTSWHTVHVSLILQFSHCMQCNHCEAS